MDAKRGNWFFLGLVLWDCGGRELDSGGTLVEEKWVAGNEPKRLIGMCRGSSRVPEEKKQRSGRRG